MLTPGISVKNVTFRREGFRTLETMNRKKTKNLLVLMVLSSAAAAAYLVFYNHEPGERELVEGMHIDGAEDKDVGHPHHHAHIDDVGQKHGKMIGDKLFLHGVNKAEVKGKVKSLADRLRDRLAERKRLQKQKEEEEEEGEQAGGGAINLEEKEEEPVEEKKVESIDSLRERLKLRLQERKKLMKAKAGLVGNKGEEKDWGVVDKKKEEEESERNLKPAVEAQEEEEEAGEEVAKPKESKIQSLVERLKARLKEQKKEKEAKEAIGEWGEIVTVPAAEKAEGKAAEKDDDPFGPEDSDDAAEAPAKGESKEDAESVDDPFGPEGGDGEEVAMVTVSARKKKKDGELRNIADIIYEKKYGMKRPKNTDNEEKDVIEPFDPRAFNRKPKLGVGEDEEPAIKPVARPMGDSADFEERRRQHINELNNGGALEEGGMPRRDHGMDAFNRKEVNNPFLKKKGFGGGFDSGRAIARNPFMKKKFGAFDAMKKKPKNINDINAFNKKKENGFGAFRGAGRESLDDIGKKPKEDGFGAFRGMGRDVDDNDGKLHPMMKPPEKKENRFINEKGLLKAGGGNPVIRPFGNNGMNPFLDNGFEGVRAKNKLPLPEVDGRDKVHFDFRNLGKKKPGLLMEDGEEDKPAIQQALPPRPPQAGAHPAEVPVPPPGHLGEAPAHPKADAIGNIMGLAQAPVLHPDAMKQRMKEVPVAPPLRLAEEVKVIGGALGKLNIHDVSSKVTKGSTTCQRYIFPAPVGSGKICLHKPSSDLVSDTIRKDGAWEHKMVTEMLSILNSDWKLGLIDVGAGIGTFTLAAALLHRPVMAIEPFYANYMALHKAANENNVESRITLITNALDGEAYTGVMTLASREDGGFSSVHINKPGEGEIVPKKRAVNVTTLNHLAQHAANPNLKTKLFAPKNIIKLDVSDNKEADILEGGTDFFKDVDVHYILTHWRKSRAQDQHMRLMTAMAKLRFQPQLSYNGDVLEMENLQMDQSYIVWVKVHTMGEM